jgi:hypothetical protein
VEFLVHAWDFASATGQKLTVSDEVTNYVLNLAKQIVTPELRESAVNPIGGEVDLDIVVDLEGSF